MLTINNDNNDILVEYFNSISESWRIKRRCELFMKRLIQDRDRIRIHGQYYNNIYLGKRIFGPARKQIFSHSIVGGIERRFEIIDNQVNHIPFTHEAFDRSLKKCKNPRVKCRDDTRIKLTFPNNELDDFIHANRITTPLLFNDFILTQAPMDNTIYDFWRMIWQENVRYIFMVINDKKSIHYWPIERGHGINLNDLQLVNENVDTEQDPLFKITMLTLHGPNDEKRTIMHYQGDMNNSDDLDAPLRLLKIARNCRFPTVIHDDLGISRASILVAIELTICNLLKGPIFKHPVQRAVHYLRSFRPFSIETPMQYIYIHKVVLHFVSPLVGDPEGFDDDYSRWLEERSQRTFVHDVDSEIPVYKLLSPTVDPDLLPLVRRKDRPEHRREMNANVGELPVPIESASNPEPISFLPKKFPRGKHY